jgi:phospholipid/cholesterol/gamma-HCH transport system substrate-binding protein
MTTETREITVGAIVFASFLAVMIFLYTGAEDVTDEGSGTRVTADFNRVDGLIEDDPVYMSGIRVGTVEKMFLNKHYRIVVALRLNDDVYVPIDSSAAIHTDGLFGGKFIVLEPGGEETAMESGARITLTQDAVVVSELLDLIISEGKAKRAAQ